MKKGMTRRRLLALVLCLAMLFSCVPQGAIPVFAAGDEASQGQTETGETTTPTEPEVTTEPTQPEVTTVPTEPEVTVEPTEPEVTTEPTQPEDTTAPTEPEATTEPTVPEDTTAPTEPEVTTEPTQPEDTTAPTEPEVTTEPTEPQNPAEPAQPQNPAVPLAGEVVDQGDYTSTIDYTVTEETDPDGTTYHVLTLTGTGLMKNYRPGSAPWYRFRSTIRQIIVGEGITSVGAEVFSSYPTLTTVELPSTLTIIRQDAFSECTNLTSLDLSSCSSLNTIDYKAFYGCSGLVELDFSRCKGLTTIGESAFENCSGLTGKLDFSGLQKLKIIGESAFDECTGLTALSFSGCSSLTTIDAGAFGRCSGLTNLNFSDCSALTTIGGTAFRGCSALTGLLDLSDCSSLVNIQYQAFYRCAGITDLDLSGCEALTTIGGEAFYKCTGLTSLSFNGCHSLNQILDAAFEDCSNLTTIVMKTPNNLATVSNSAFDGAAVKSLFLAFPDQTSADGASVLLSALPEGPLWVTLGGASVQQMFLSEDFLKTVQNNRYRITFEPGFLTFDQEAPASVPGAAPLNTLMGPAWVDDRGVVYLLNDADQTASLAYIPSDLKSYTVPEKVGDGERTYTLTSVSSHALARAYQLEEITFVAPKAVTLADFSLAGCQTLASVNEEITVEGAKSLFNSVGESAFLNTGLQEKPFGTEVPLGTPISALQNPNATFTLNAQAAEPILDGITGTGNSVTITAYVDGSEADKFWYRIYFLISNGQFDFEGLQMEVGKEYDGGNGFKLILHRHPQIPGLYYVDITAAIGATWNRSFILNYPALTSGGQVLVWAESGMGEATFDIQTYPDNEYYCFTWETESAPYAVSVINSGTNYGYMRPGVNQPITLSPDLSWQVKLTAESRKVYGAYTSVALDPARQAAHTMTLTLPNGFSWNDAITGSLKEGGQMLNLKGGSWCLGDIPLLKATPDSDTYVQKVAAALVEGKLTLTLWQTAKSQTLPATPTLSLSMAQGAVVVDEGLDFGQIHEISLVVNTQVVYTFDQPLSGDGSARWESVKPERDLKYAKESDKSSAVIGYDDGYYQLSATNDTIFPHSLTKISDPLPMALFITPQGIRELFTLSTGDLDNGNLAKYLSLTISNARRYQYGNSDNALGYVTLSDGETQYLLTAEMTDQYGTDFQNDVEVTITLGDNEGNLKVAFENENAVEVPMDNLEYYFQTHGLALLSDTQYTVTWNFGSDHEILSGDAYLLRIPVEPKSSFQLLVKDWVIFRGASTSDNPSEYDRRYYYINNNATFLDPGSNTRSIDKDYGVDYAIGKTVNTSTIQNGGILNYTIQVYQSSDLPRKAGLPVVDAVSGTQCLLAPVSENQSRPWAEKTQIYRASDGTEYYLLELPESEKEIGRYVYEGVWLNGDYADSVTVTALDKLKPEEAEKYNHTADYSSIGNALADDGYLTEIRWYLTSASKYRYRLIEYSVLVDVAYSLQENALSGTVCNVAYLNDRDNHRLFYPTGNIPVYTVGGSKELLDENGQVLGNNSTISAGETVHYRLSINNWIPRAVTINTKDLLDALPSTYGVFQWTEENVKLRYTLASGASTENFSWVITCDEAGNYSICWPDGVQVPGNDTLYICVDLTFPDDSSGDGSLWKAYCDVVQSNTLTNTFRLINDTYSVSHNLALPGGAYIQQGVWSSYYYCPYRYYTVGGNKDYRYYTQSTGAGKGTMEENFYILLYNDGPGPLYLTDVLVQFPLGNISSVQSPDLITDTELFAGLPQDMTLVQASIGDYSDHKSILYTFEPSSYPYLEGMPTISYDAAAGAYYLKPNQAIAFSYECRIVAKSSYWENTVAMPLYDPNNAGVGVAEISQIYNNYSMDGKIGNDGGCTYWTVEEGTDHGYTSSQAQKGWVSSAVSLRKETVAGLEKHVVQRRSGGITYPYVNYAGPGEALQWELTVYNDGKNMIEGFTITDTLPGLYALDVGDVIITGLSGTSQTSQTLFSVEKVVTNGSKVTEIHLQDGNIVTVDGEAIVDEAYDLKLYYNPDGQLVMELSIHLEGKESIIWPGEKVKLTFWSKNYTNTSVYATYVNSAVLTTRQELNYDKVSHGRIEWDENGEPAGILARAIAVTAGGYSTGSEKAVTEVGIPGNTASSNQIGSITLTQTDGGYSHFTYELQVDNSATGAKGMKWITLIDNLPQLDDTMTLNPKIQRGSGFQVEFAENLQVKVWYVTEYNQRVDLSNAVIRYSDKVTFGSDDWGAVNTPPTDVGWRETSAGARSIRIYIPSDGETPAVPAGATLHVSFECQVKMGESIVPGHTAWNSFGYRYQMQNDQYYLEAAPLEVGVRIPDYPRIQKVLTDETGEAVTAQKDTEFYFLVYKGDKISGDFATGAALLQALMDEKTDFSIVKVTVPQGQSQVELKLEDLKICTYTPENGWTETNAPWAWRNGESYTIVELGDQLTVGLGSYKDYQFASLDYTPDNSYTFQYNKSTSQLIRGENTLALRKLQIQKVDQADQSQKLPGAVFGLYSPNTSDQLTGDALQVAATALELTTGQIQELEGKLIITHNGKNYYLYRLGKTDKNGLITWDNLTGMSYCYVELWAPEGYYITEKEPVLVSFDVQGEYLRNITHTVTNKEIVYLPKTGGMGRWQIPALGLLLCAAVVTVFLGKRRKKAA